MTHETIKLLLLNTKTLPPTKLLGNLYLPRRQLNSQTEVFNLTLNTVPCPICPKNKETDMTSYFGNIRGFEMER